MSKKPFNLRDDVVFTTSRINEHIRFTTASLGLTGTLGSGTVSSPHVKSYVHWVSASISGGYYQSVFDREKTSISANRLFDITFGASNSSSFANTGSGVDVGLVTNQDEKKRIYRLFAQKLLGRPDLTFNFQGVQRDELIFISFARNQYKDEIKPGTMRFEAIFSGNVLSIYEKRIFADKTSLDLVEETPGGPRGFITLLSSSGMPGGPPVPPGSTGSYGIQAGAIYYKAGTMVLIPEVVSSTSGTWQNFWWTSGASAAPYNDLAVGKSGYTYENLVSGCRQRFLEFDFRNQTNMRTTFYTCVAERNEFNYSPNPTFVDKFGKINTTSGSENFQSQTYISRIGLLGQNGEIIAVGNLNRAVKKNPNLRVEIKVRLHY